MRILVFEFASGGGCAASPLPASLVREGRAMLTALLTDLVAIGRHTIVTTSDRRLALRVPRGVDVVTIGPEAAPLPDNLVSSVDAVWLIAPETDGCLEQLASRIERAGKTLLGTGSAAIRRAADKRQLPRRLARCGLAHPPTRVLHHGVDAIAVAADLGYPIVVKPSRGAGCCGVSLARNPRALRAAIDATSSGALKQEILLQHHVRGVSASVSLLCDGRRAVAVSVNAQAIRAGSTFLYRGGSTPLDHPLADRALDAAIRTCESFPGLRGYVGVDLVLSAAEAVVIEINPRLTTAYLGVREAVNGNMAAMALHACSGSLPAPPRLERRVRFTARGHVISTPLDLSLSNDELMVRQAHHERET